MVYIYRNWFSVLLKHRLCSQTGQQSVEFKLVFYRCGKKHYRAQYYVYNSRDISNMYCIYIYNDIAQYMKLDLLRHIIVRHPYLRDLRIWQTFQSRLAAQSSIFTKHAKMAMGRLKEKRSWRCLIITETQLRARCPQRGVLLDVAAWIEK